MFIFHDILEHIDKIIASNHRKAYMQHNRIPFGHRHEDNAMIPPPKSLPLNPGATLTSPLLDAHAMVFAAPPFKGEFVAKSQRKIYYYDNHGTVVPSLSVTSLSKDVFFMGFLDSDSVRLCTGVVDPVTKQLTIELRAPGVGVRMLRTVQLPVEYAYSSVDTTIMLTGVYLNKAPHVSFIVLANKADNGSVINKMLRVSLTSDAVEVVDIGANSQYSWLLVRYCTQCTDGRHAVFTGAAHRVSSADTLGAISIVSGSNFYEVMYPTTYLPTPALPASMNPYQLIIPVTSDVVTFSSSVSENGASLGGSLPTQRMFSRNHFDAWLRDVSLNKGNLYAAVRRTTSKI